MSKIKYFFFQKSTLIWTNYFLISKIELHFNNNSLEKQI